MPVDSILAVYKVLVLPRECNEHYKFFTHHTLHFLTGYEPGCQLNPLRQSPLQTPTLLLMANHQRRDKPIKLQALVPLDYHLWVDIAKSTLYIHRVFVRYSVQGFKSCILRGLQALYILVLNSATSI